MCTSNKVHLALCIGQEGCRADCTPGVRLAASCNNDGTVRATMMCWCLWILCVYTVHVQSLSVVGLNPLGKYTVKGPTVLPSTSTRARMCTTSGNSSGLRFNILLGDSCNLWNGTAAVCTVLAKCAFQVVAALLLALRNQDVSVARRRTTPHVAHECSAHRLGNSCQ